MNLKEFSTTIEHNCKALLEKNKEAMYKTFMQKLTIDDLVNELKNRDLIFIGNWFTKEHIKEITNAGDKKIIEFIRQSNNENLGVDEPVAKILELAINDFKWDV